MKEAFLGQVRPPGTTAVKAVSVKIDSVVTRIIVCETSGSARTFSIFYDYDGEEANDQTKAIYYSVAISANTTADIETYLPMKANKSAIYVSHSANNAINFTFTGEQR